MKKNFKLTASNKHPDRVVDSIKNEIRKYIKREKRKALPEGFDYWDFECKFAQKDETPTAINFNDITACIDAAAKAQCETFYMEIMAKAGKKVLKVKEETSIEEEQAE